MITTRKEYLTFSAMLSRDKDRLDYLASRLKTADAPKSIAILERMDYFQQLINQLEPKLTAFEESFVHIKWKDFLNLLQFHEECKKFFSTGIFEDDGVDWEHFLTDEEEEERWRWVFQLEDFLKLQKLDYRPSVVAHLEKIKIQFEKWGVEL